VNHDPNFLALVAKLFASAGCDTVTTWAHAHALMLIECQAFDVLIDEYSGMPLPSVRSLRTMRQKQPAAVLIVIHEAALEPAELNQLHAMGVYAAISKWDLKELVRTVRDLQVMQNQPAASSDVGTRRTSPPGRVS